MRQLSVSDLTEGKSPVTGLLFCLSNRYSLSILALFLELLNKNIPPVLKRFKFFV